MIQHPWIWSNFSIELDELQNLKIRFPEFSIVFIPRSENISSDSLAKIARSFQRDMYYIGCFIPVWFYRPPQAWLIDQPFDAKKKEKKITKYVHNCFFETVISVSMDCNIFIILFKNYFLRVRLIFTVVSYKDIFNKLKLLHCCNFQYLYFNFINFFILF